MKEENNINNSKKNISAGHFPYRRGIYEGMYKDKLWTMRQYSGMTSAIESNKRFKYLLGKGVNGLSVAFDLPTQIGYDSDHPMSIGEVGKVGVPISSIYDMDLLFDKIDLSKISTSMTINSTACILLAFYVCVAEKRGIPLSKIQGTIQNDILKEYIARGTYIYPPDHSLRIISDIFEFCSENIPKWNTISISGYHIREAGSSLVQELAFTFANAITYVETAIKKGLDPNVFGSRISFFFNAHNGFLEEIAKFRAAREIWATIMKTRFKVTNEKALKCRFHVQTGGSTLTAQQPQNNIVRTTIQALSAVLGGAQSIHTNSYDEALGLPTEEAAKIALRTQQLIANETNLVKFVDPLFGSDIIETLTEKYILKANEILKEIDQIGGAVKAIEDDYMQRNISQTAYEYQKSIDNNSTCIVGLNCHEEEDVEIDLQRINAQSVNDQIKKLKKIKKNRDSALVAESLEDLKTAAESNSNLMPFIIKAAKNECTLGEISDIFRECFGEYKMS